MQVLKKAEKLEKNAEKEDNGLARLKLYVEECLVCRKRLKKDQECTHKTRRKLRKGEKKEF